MDIAKLFSKTDIFLGCKQNEFEKAPEGVHITLAKNITKPNAFSSETTEEALKAFMLDANVFVQFKDHMLNAVSANLYGTKGNLTCKLNLPNVDLEEGDLLDALTAIANKNGYNILTIEDINAKLKDNGKIYLPDENKIKLDPDVFANNEIYMMYRNDKELETQGTVIDFARNIGQYGFCNTNQVDISIFKAFDTKPKYKKLSPYEIPVPDIDVDITASGGKLVLHITYQGIGLNLSEIRNIVETNNYILLTDDDLNAKLAKYGYHFDVMENKLYELNDMAHTSDIETEEPSESKRTY